MHHHGGPASREEALSPPVPWVLSPPATPATALSQDTAASEQKPCLSKEFFFIFII